MTKGTLRMRKMWGALNLTTGPGALALPPAVSRIDMAFSLTKAPTGEGAGAFWKIILPAIKYNNPNVPISLDRYNGSEKPSLLTVHFSALTSATSNPATQQLVKSIDLHDKTIDQILREFKDIAKPTPIPVSDEDADRLRYLQRIREIQKQTTANMERSRAKEELKASIAFS